MKKRNSDETNKEISIKEFVMNEEDIFNSKFNEIEEVDGKENSEDINLDDGFVLSEDVKKLLDEIAG